MTCVNGMVGSVQRRRELVFFPDYRAANPYQDLLYRSLEPHVSARPGTIDELTDLAPHAGLPLFHLHWDDELTRHHDEAKSLKLVRAFLSALERFKDRGGRVLWTLHNLFSNHGRNPQAFAELRDQLVALVDVVHLHSLQALAATRGVIDLPARKVRIVPHGHYGSMYPRFERMAARAELGLADAGSIAVLPGRIASYKNADGLIETFLRVAGPDDHLAIVGFLADTPAGAGPGGDPRIILNGGYATARDLALRISAADFVVLPYRRSLTSGSAILAASLSRGVLGARTPGIEDAVTHETTGIVFEPDGFDDALRRALGEGAEVWAERGRAAWSIARARDWDTIGQQWIDMIRRVEASIPAGHSLEVVQ